MKSLISITSFFPTISSIEFVIDSTVYISKDNIFLYYNNKIFNSFDYEFLTNSSNNTTKFKIIPYNSFDQNGCTTLFIETENFISNTIFSYFSFDIITVSNNEHFTTLTAHIPEKMLSTNYKLYTFTPYTLIDSIPPTTISIINSVDPVNSTIALDSSNEDYNVYDLTLIDKLSSPLPNDNYIVNFYFEGGEIII